MLDQKVRRGWERLMGPVGRTLARAGVTPNMVTAFGLVAQAAAAYLIVAGHLVIAGCVAIAAAFADTFDGAVAKARGLRTTFGALLDSTIDRLSDALFFVPVAWLYGVRPDPPHSGQQWVAGVALAAMVASFLVSYVKARAEGLGLECNVGIAARAERVIVMIAGLVLNVLPVVVTLLAVLSTVTFVQRVVHVHRQTDTTRVG